MIEWRDQLILAEALNVVSDGNGVARECFEHIEPREGMEVSCPGHAGAICIIYAAGKFIRILPPFGGRKEEMAFDFYIAACLRRGRIAAA